MGNLYLKDILVDADALVAIAKQDDTNHKKALLIEKKLEQEGVILYFSPFTVAEVVTVLSHKVSQISAKKFLKEIRELDISVFELPEKYKILADEWFFKQNKKGTSYFDCYNLALLDRYKKQISAIFSFDEVYKRNGFVLAQDLVLN